MVNTHHDKCLPTLFPAHLDTRRLSLTEGNPSALRVDLNDWLSSKTHIYITSVTMVLIANIY